MIPVTGTLIKLNVNLQSWLVRISRNHVFRGGPKYTIFSPSGRGISVV